MSEGRPFQAVALGRQQPSCRLPTETQVCTRGACFLLDAAKSCHRASLHAADQGPEEAGSVCVCGSQPRSLLDAGPEVAVRQA